MLKKLRDTICKRIQRNRAAVCRAAITIYCMTACKMKVCAIQNSIYVTGTKKLAADALVAIQVVAAVVLVAILAWEELKKHLGDEQDAKPLKKQQIGLIIGLIVIETIGTAIGVIGGYYGIAFS